MMISEDYTNESGVVPATWALAAWASLGPLFPRGHGNQSDASNTVKVVRFCQMRIPLPMNVLKGRGRNEAQNRMIALSMGHDTFTVFFSSSLIVLLSLGTLPVRPQKGPPGSSTSAWNRTRDRGGFPYDFERHCVRGTATRTAYRADVILYSPKG
ncbi:hypothetical protein LY78DRAFT_441264 [Colletotrichum sublineola]|nr:hypothetical protein LY78DRAFT_441264 [Colletotrichum sublineola]